jgi:LPS-assembly protein
VARGGLIAALLLGLALGAVPAAAQGQRGTAGEREAPILFTADELQNDEELGLVVAKGHVQISQGLRTLLADTVTYNQRSDTITASGNVSLQEPTGEILFANYLELSDHYQEGFMQEIRALLSDRSRLAGNTARRTGGNRLELRRGVYSPCDLCKDDPSAPPIWQLRAERIVHDQNTHTIEYHDAILEMGGIPVFYTPYLSHPDPTVKRRSGFLIPTVGRSVNLGFHSTVPYYWAIAPDRDATFSPIFTSRSGQVAAGEYRQRFSDGKFRTSGSVNYDPTGTTRPGTALRGHLNGDGNWDLDQNWRSGFVLNRSTDQTYLRRFHFGGTENFLTNRAFAERFDQRSFAAVNAYAFQSLRAGTNDSTQPIVLPDAGYNWLGQPNDYGARWSFNANALNLNRLRGTGSHRVSVGGGWSLPFNGPLGDLYTISATTRGDIYYATDFRAGAPTDPARDSYAGRVFPQLALNWRYPWLRRGEHFSQLVEPIAEFVAGPKGGNSARIPNEDSLAFDFDDTDLFVPNRFPGYDRVDGGERVDYGLRTAVYGDHGASSRLLVGQSYRMQFNGGFAENSGLKDKLSDVVGRLVVTPGSWFDATYRFRLDKRNLRSQRQEIAFAGGPEQLRLSLSYITLPPDLTGTDPGRRQQISAGLTAGLTRYWTVALSTTQNLRGDLGTVSSGIVAVYRDECFSFITSLTQSGTRDRDVKPGASLLFSLVFKNLGEISAPAFATAGVQY